MRASRITYVGELGWELYVPSEFMQGVYDELLSAGPRFELAHAGYHALNSLRIEKAYRHFGHDITEEDTPLEAGLGFAVRWDKPGGFIGREALLQHRDAGAPKRRLVQFLLQDPGPMLYHNEPIYRDGEIGGYTTSAMYGHTLGAAVALGYIEAAAGASDDYINAGRYEIQVDTRRMAARASLTAMYDPKSARIRQ